MKDVAYFIFDNGYCCSESHLMDTQEIVLSNAPAVPPGLLVTLPLLCGKAYWDPLSKWEKTLAGMCMDYLVKHNRVPFENVPRKGRNPYPLQYRIKESRDI